jgi:hypothetical protein|tara:strand:- start:889 stop:1116 length:228 start_codon:yes stop_codon:yes gene_type:complete
MPESLTPFERAKVSINSFSYGLHNDYMLQSILPMIERMSKLYEESIESGDEKSASYYKNTESLLLSAINPIDVGA